MIVTLDAKRRLTVPEGLSPALPGDTFDARFEAAANELVFRRIAGAGDWLAVLSECPVGLTQRDKMKTMLKMDPHSARSKVKTSTKAKRALRRDLFGELSERMAALALLRPEPRKAGTKAGTKRVATVTS
jgi:hypothetical protein